MLIRCPECQFERDIDTSAIPAAATVATCPRCSHRFRFRDPETGESLLEKNMAVASASASGSVAAPESAPVFGSADEASVNAPANTSVNAVAREESLPGQAQAPLRRLPTEQEGDDPLPPGAVIPHLGDDMPYTGEIAPKLEEGAGEADGVKIIPPVSVPKAAERASAAKSWFPFGKKHGADKEQPKREDAVPSRPHMPEDSARHEDESVDQPELRMRNGRHSAENDVSPLDWRAEEQNMVPWEHPEVFGLVGSFGHTVLRAMFRPQELFRAVGRDFPVFRATLFYVLLRCFGAFFALLWFRADLQRLLNSGVSAQTEATVQTLLGGMSTPLLVLFIPFVMLIGLFLLSFFFFIMLRLANPEQVDFNTVLRVIAYSAAPYVLCVVPVLGAHAAYLLSAVLCFVGCRFAFRLGWGRTLLALAPLYLLWIGLNVFTINATSMLTAF